MTVYSFRLILDRRPTEEELDELFEIGCDDAAFGKEGGLPIVEFGRDGETESDAIRSAIHQVRSAGFSVKAIFPVKD